MKRALWLILAAVLSAPSPAQDVRPREDALRSGFYVTPLLSHASVDEERGTDDGIGYALAGGYRGNFAAVELMASGVSLDNPGGGSTSLQSVGINMLVAPLVMVPGLRDVHLLLGYALNQRENHPGFAEDDDTYFFDAGIAYLPQLPLFDLDMALRVEYVFRTDTQQPVFNDMEPREFSDALIRLGVQIPLSKRPVIPETTAPAVAVVEPQDTDADGVLDDTDQCPDTTAGATVDQQGCEPPPPPPPPPPPCVTTGDAWQLDGCEAGTRIVLEGVNFDTDSAKLDAAAKTALRVAIQALRDYPRFDVLVGGHTDNRGDAAYNQALSQRRANAVRAHLVSAGIAADRVEAAGYGESQPVQDNDTPAGRAQNRRVDLSLRLGPGRKDDNNE